MKKPSSTVLTMMLLTLCAKAAGLFRNILMAREFGVGVKAEAFAAASRIPLSFFDLLFSAAILGCFIPVYNSFSEDEAERRDGYAVTFFHFISLLCGALALLGILFAPAILSAASPGLTGETKALAVTLLRILFPMILFAAEAYTLVGIFQSKGRFLLPAAISLFSNGLIVLYLFFVNPSAGERDIHLLAVVYLLAWLLQFLTLFIPLRASGFAFPLRMNLRDPALKRSLQMTPPIMIGSWLLPAGWLVATFFASLSGTEGGIAMFDYANNAYLMIAGILTYSICNYIFPRLSRLKEGESEFGQTLENSITVSLLLILPCLAALLVLGDEVIAVLYLGEAFTREAAVQTSPLLKILVCAMPFFALNELLSRAFYSRQQTRPPMTAALFGVLTNIAVCCLTSLFTKSMTGVALGALAAQAVSALLMLVTALRRGMVNKTLLLRLALALAVSLPAALLMGFARSLFPADAFSASKAASLGTAAAVFACGAALYALLLYLFRRKLFPKGVTTDGR